MYIGELSIKNVEHDGDKVILTFKKDHPESIINENLFEDIVTEDKGRGNVTDVVGHLLATKLLYDLSEYDLDYYMVEVVGTKAKVLAHNLREALFSKQNDCAATDDIKLKKLTDEEAK